MLFATLKSPSFESVSVWSHLADCQLDLTWPTSFLACLASLAGVNYIGSMIGVIRIYS